ncbi:7696_t:CDS:2 [Entrophospora sp. SA101]|nr:7696_t:CDS:2 [Entrophospora sp. SA101]
MNRTFSVNNFVSFGKELVEKGEFSQRSGFILIATTSTYETEKLSDPLLSCLDLVNADTSQPKKIFLDKYFY